MSVDDVDITSVKYPRYLRKQQKVKLKLNDISINNELPGLIVSPCIPQKGMDPLLVGNKHICKGKNKNLKYPANETLNHINRNSDKLIYRLPTPSDILRSKNVNVPKVKKIERFNSFGSNRTSKSLDNSKSLKDKESLSKIPKLIRSNSCNKTSNVCPVSTSSPNVVVNYEDLEKTKISASNVHLSSITSNNINSAWNDYKEDISWNDKIMDIISTDCLNNSSVDYSQSIITNSEFSKIDKLMESDSDQILSTAFASDTVVAPLSPLDTAECCANNNDDKAENGLLSLDTDKCAINNKDNNAENELLSLDTDNCAINNKDNNAENELLSLDTDKCANNNKDNKAENGLPSLDTDKCSANNNTENGLLSLDTDKCSANNNVDNKAESGLPSLIKINTDDTDKCSTNNNAKNGLLSLDTDACWANNNEDKAENGLSSLDTDKCCTNNNEDNKAENGLLSLDTDEFCANNYGDNKADNKENELPSLIKINADDKDECSANNNAENGLLSLDTDKCCCPNNNEDNRAENGLSSLDTDKCCTNNNEDNKAENGLLSLDTDTDKCSANNNNKAENGSLSLDAVECSSDNNNLDTKKEIKINNVEMKFSDFIVILKPASEIKSIPIVPTQIVQPIQIEDVHHDKIKDHIITEDYSSENDTMSDSYPIDNSDEMFEEENFIKNENFKLDELCSFKRKSDTLADFQKCSNLSIASKEQNINIELLKTHNGIRLPIDYKAAEGNIDRKSETLVMVKISSPKKICSFHLYINELDLKQMFLLLYLNQFLLPTVRLISFDRKFKALKCDEKLQADIHFVFKRTKCLLPLRKKIDCKVSLNLIPYKPRISYGHLNNFLSLHDRAMPEQILLTVDHLEVKNSSQPSLENNQRMCFKELIDKGNFKNDNFTEKNETKTIQNYFDSDNQILHKVDYNIVNNLKERNFNEDIGEKFSLFDCESLSESTYDWSDSYYEFDHNFRENEYFASCSYTESESDSKRNHNRKYNPYKYINRDHFTIYKKKIEYYETIEYKKTGPNDYETIKTTCTKLPKSSSFLNNSNTFCRNWGPPNNKHLNSNDNFGNKNFQTPKYVKRYYKTSLPKSMVRLPPLVSKKILKQTTRSADDRPEFIENKESSYKKSTTHTIDSAYSSLTRVLSEGDSAKGEQARFCHECGTQYPIALAKFCCYCGMKRIAL